jgi:hypothetical protein
MICALSTLLKKKDEATNPRQHFGSQLPQMICHDARFESVVLLSSWRVI